MNKNLQIYYRDEEILLPDNEAFEVDYLKNWTLKNISHLRTQAGSQYFSRPPRTLLKSGRFDQEVIVKVL